MSQPSNRQLTRTKGCEWTPIFSPDGQDIAFTATKRSITTIDSVAEDTHVFLIPASNGTGQGIEAHELNKELDRRAFVVRWSHDGRFVLFTPADHGKNAALSSNTSRIGQAVIRL
jgi:Tol biopolymer transport system component